MGGIGSGNWYRWQGKKATVEESLTVAMRDFRGQIHPHSSGVLTWVWPSGKQASVGYRVAWEEWLTITLRYSWRDREDIEIPIRVQTTPTQFGGERRWFTCPLVADDAACDRRVGKLYLPPGGKYFGCRKCHNLAYRSSQEAHRSERGTGTCAWMERWTNSILDRE